MYTYTAYGLNISSSLKLPELVESNFESEDVIIRFAKLESSPLGASTEYYSFAAEEEGMYLFWQEIGTILISEGREIIIDPVLDRDESRLRLFILGAAMGTLLHQRGYTVLHASAVSIAGKAVVFTADKRRGKSTMAAALHHRGHHLIADDVVAIDFKIENKPMIYPAFPQLKLWPDAVSHLGKNPNDLPQLTKSMEKRDYLPKQDFVRHPLVLKQIFVLGQSSQIEIKPLAPQEIIFYLLRNTYITRFGSSLLKPGDTSYLFKLTKLAQKVSVKHLLRPNNIELLSEVARTVEDLLATSS